MLAIICLLHRAWPYLILFAIYLLSNVLLFFSTLNWFSAWTASRPQFPQKGSFYKYLNLCKYSVLFFVKFTSQPVNSGAFSASRIPDHKRPSTAPICCLLALKPTVIYLPMFILPTPSAKSSKCQNFWKSYFAHPTQLVNRGGFRASQIPDYRNSFTVRIYSFFL